MKFLSTLLLAALVLSAPEAFAGKRLGGGQSVGKQSGNVAQHVSPTPGPPGQAVPASAPLQKAASPSAAPTAPEPARRPWGSMLGGLAAGLGLAWLASSLGLGEAFGQVLMWGLVALLVMAGVGMFLRARQARHGGGLAYQGGGATLGRPYSPQNVGNDASARPWESTSTRFENSRMGDTGSFAAVGGGSLIGSALTGSRAWGIPADFDVEGFLRASKTNFIGLQAAWDRSDIPALRAMMTDDMLEQIKTQLAEREHHTGGQQPNTTEVVMLEARLLGIEELEHDHMASVEFSGMIREDVSAGPSPFREVWNITRPKAGSGGWLVAGVQALQ
jgi:predicted lipid-binding transport protein (Tim44 family)